MFEKYIETEGPDMGRVKDIDIAMDLADIEYAWREEGDGRPMLDPPERLGKHEVHFREILNEELKRLIKAKEDEDFDRKFDAIYNTPEIRAKDPENSDPRWIAYRNDCRSARIRG